MQSEPNKPGFLFRILRSFCPPELLESIEGDLIEQYEEDLKYMNQQSAQWRLTLRTLAFLRPGIIFRNNNSLSLNMRLLSNHFKVSLRQLKKHWGYSLIHIIGLSVGIAACVLIYSYTSFEKGYDSFHDDIDQLYRVNQTNIWRPEGGQMSSTGLPLGKVLDQDFPEVLSSLRINDWNDQTVQYKNQNGEIVTYRESILGADSSFFNFFSFPLRKGDAKNALHKINQIVISDEMALKYFGHTDPMGQILLIGEESIPMTVVGVTEKQPENAHLNFDFLTNIYSNPSIEMFEWSWIWTQVTTYVKMRKDARLDQFEENMQSIQDKHIPATFDRLGMDMDEFVGNKGGWHFYLQSVRDIHLYSQDIGNDLGEIGDIKMVNILQLLALLILFLAIVNYINLSTARGGLRASEISVKKTLGAGQSSLAMQFIVESVTTTFIAMCLAIPLLILIQSAMEKYVGLHIALKPLEGMNGLYVFLTVNLIIGIIAGLYPAFYLSRFSATDLEKKNAGSQAGNLRFRQVLVTLQFAISIGLIASSILIHRQLHFLNDQNMGFNKDQLLVINHVEALEGNMDVFKNDMRGTPLVEYASLAMEMPGRGSWEDIFMREGSETKLPISQIKIDEQFFPALELEIVAGRTFREESTDDHNVIINETTARLFGWKSEEAVGEKIIYPGYPVDLRIIGVVRDFHFQSLHHSIAPLAFFHRDSYMWGDQRLLAIKYAGPNMQELISEAQSKWQAINPNFPFSYSVYSDELEQLYENENQLSRLITAFSGFSFLIALLGLIGLVSFAIDQRRKELSIRRVLGATYQQIFFLLNKQFLLLLLIGGLIAIPTSWKLLNGWLSTFAYSTNVQASIFVIAILVIGILALGSISLFVLKAIKTNPAETLKEN